AEERNRDEQSGVEPEVDQGHRHLPPRRLGPGRGQHPCLGLVVAAEGGWHDFCRMGFRPFRINCKALAMDGSIRRTSSRCRRAPRRLLQAGRFRRAQSSFTPPPRFALAGAVLVAAGLPVFFFGRGEGLEFIHIQIPPATSATATIPPPTLSS